MTSKKSISRTLREIRRIEFENEVGKASTLIAIFILLTISVLSFVIELSLPKIIIINNKIKTIDITLVMIFFLVDMLLAYHFVD